MGETIYYPILNRMLQEGQLQDILLLLLLLLLYYDYYYYYYYYYYIWVKHDANGEWKSLHKE